MFNNKHIIFHVVIELLSLKNNTPTEIILFKLKSQFDIDIEM